MSSEVKHKEQQLGCYQREDWAPGKTHRSWCSNVSWRLVFPSLASESPWLTAAAGVLPVDGHPDVWPKFTQLRTLHRYHTVRQLFVGLTKAFFHCKKWTFLVFFLLRTVNMTWMWELQTKEDFPSTTEKQRNKRWLHHLPACDPISWSRKTN